MNLSNLLEDLSNAFGPSGFEDEVNAVARRYAPSGVEFAEDSLRNLYLRSQIRAGDKPVVMLDAHSDEVGFIVQAIRPNGLLQILPLGGWVSYTIPAHKVLIRNSGGRLISGVVASKPPHFLSGDQQKKVPEISSMYVDVGASSADEAREVFGIAIGAPVAPDVRFTHNPLNDVAMGKAFDCRVGCACVVATISQVIQNNLAVEPVGVFSTQEEVGLRGAIVAAKTVNPAVSIVFEGSPADDTFAEPWAAQTALGKGPMLRHFDQGMITNPRFMRFALETAREASIPFQEGVRSGGRTDGAAIHLSGSGVPTVVIGIPVRYIHTHHGYMNMKDMDAAISLGIAMLRRLTPDIIAGF